MKATERPWVTCGDIEGTVSIRPEWDKRRKLAVMVNGSKWQVGYPELMHDAALIVKAVNHFDEMVTALKSLLVAIGNQDIYSSCAERIAADKARALLAKLEE